MATSIYVYAGISYGVPLGFFGTMIIIMSCFGKKLHDYVIKGVLGVKVKRPDQKAQQPILVNEASKSIDKQTVQGSESALENFESFLFVEVSDTNDNEAGLPLKCFVRFLLDVFASGILAVLFAIIFESCILSYDSLTPGSECPEYNTTCFLPIGYDRSIQFDCRKNEYVNFSVTAPRYICYGWIYPQQNAREVLDVIGVSAGLLSMISSILPLVYYLTHKKRWWCLSILSIVFPIISILGLVVTIIYTKPADVSTLTIISFSLLITMVTVGWLWGLIVTCKKRCRCCISWKFSERCCCYHICCAYHTDYPFCWRSCALNAAFCKSP